MAMRDQARARVIAEMERRRRFTIREIARAAGAKYDTANRVVWEMRRKGAIRCEVLKDNGRAGGCAVYVLERAPAAPASSARYRIWRAMRIMRRFQIGDLIATAVAGESNVQKYVFDLTRAGYLRLARARQSGVKAGSAVYVLIEDSGPLPPRIIGNGMVFDPNRAREVRQERNAGNGV
ncbi:MAG: hypothetical protein ACREQ4_08315 [Candidatus Binataceae bacterium]